MALNFYCKPSLKKLFNLPRNYFILQTLDLIFNNWKLPPCNFSYRNDSRIIFLIHNSSQWPKLVVSRCQYIWKVPDWTRLKSNLILQNLLLICLRFLFMLLICKIQDKLNSSHFPPEKMLLHLGTFKVICQMRKASLEENDNLFEY